MKKSLSALILILFTVHVFSQTPEPVNSYMEYDAQNIRTFIIKDIQVTGVKFLQTTYLVNISGLSVGQEIDVPGDAISKAIDKFWSLGLFSDVKVIATKIEGRYISLEIQLAEQPRLAKLTIKGLKKNDTKDVDEKIKLKPGNQITENVLNNTVTIIKKHFVDKGFFKVNVDFVQKADTSPGNKVFLDIIVNKGKRVKISDITFTGNEAFTDRRLRRTMKKTKQKSINIFKPSKYIDEQYKEDKKKFIGFYNKHGYRDAQILSEKLVDLNNKRIGLELTIEEGQQYFIRNISWVGNTKHSSESLGRVLSMKKGDVYDQEFLDKRLRTDDDAVQSQYMDEGYLFSSVEPVEINIDQDSIDLEVRIIEGNPANINRVLVKGNTKTNEHVIRREVRTVPGDLFSRTLIIRSVRELAAMGHFNPENIVPNILPNPADGTVDIEYSVEERSNDQLEVSGGWGGYGFVGTIGLRFSNFSARKILDPKAWRPVPTGDGQTLSVRAQSNGRFYQAYNISFVEPWFGGKKPNSFSTSLYYTVTHPYRTFRDARSDGYFKVLGSSVGLGRRLKWPDDYFVLYTELEYQRYMLNNYSSYFLITDGLSQIIDFNISLSRSSQDQMIYPRRGSAFSFGVKLTPPYSLFKKDGFWKLTDNEVLQIRDQVGKQYEGDTRYGEKEIELAKQQKVADRENSNKFKFIEYHKWTFNGAWYTKIVKDLVISAKSEFGYLGFYNPDIGTSPFEKFDVGGSGMMGYNLYGTDIVALRGYSEGSITPTTIRNGTSIDDGNVYIKYTMELRYPFSLNPSATIFGLAFIEGGNAWSKFEDFNPFSIKRSAGVGIRAFLPMFGMLGIDWGYGFDMPNSSISGSDINKGRHGGEFHFTMGQNF
ncbi:MAG TPA: outer membrane protein assembly factor BamA [Bacteroidales bacterium]|nr:outer membrane protein assembly factor BamA [Bacteroidales bacterium]